MDAKIREQIIESLQGAMYLGQNLCAELLAGREFTAEELHGRFMQVSTPIAAAKAAADTLLPPPVAAPTPEPIPPAETPLAHEEPLPSEALPSTAGESTQPHVDDPEVHGA